MLKQVWWEEDCRDEEPVVAKPVARHRVGIDYFHLKMEQAYMGAPCHCHRNRVATNLCPGWVTGPPEPTLWFQVWHF